MSPEEADRLGLKPFGDGGAENETSPCRGSAEDLFRFFCEGFSIFSVIFYDFLRPLHEKLKFFGTFWSF